MIVFRSAAEAELSEAWARYDGIDSELGSSFLSQVDDALLRALDNPLAYQVVHDDVRHVRLRRFPHAVYFRVVRDVLVVFAVWHPARNPGGLGARR